MLHPLMYNNYESKELEKCYKCFLFRQLGVMYVEQPTNDLTAMTMTFGLQVMNVVTFYEFFM